MTDTELIVCIISGIVLFVGRLAYIKWDNGKVTLQNLLWTLIFSTIPIFNIVFLVTAVTLLIGSLLFTEDGDIKLF